MYYYQNKVIHIYYIAGMRYKKEVEELEAFFAGITIPKIVRINKAITQTDAPKFVKETIELLKEDKMTPTISELRLNMLKELKEAILNNKPL